MFKFPLPTNYGNIDITVDTQEQANHMLAIASLSRFEFQIESNGKHNKLRLYDRDNNNMISFLPLIGFKADTHRSHRNKRDKSGVMQHHRIYTDFDFRSRFYPNKDRRIKPMAIKEFLNYIETTQHTKVTKPTLVTKPVVEQPKPTVHQYQHTTSDFNQKQQEMDMLVARGINILDAYKAVFK